MFSVSCTFSSGLQCCLSGLNLRSKEEDGFVFVISVDKKKTYVKWQFDTVPFCFTPFEYDTIGKW